MSSHVSLAKLAAPNSHACFRETFQFRPNRTLFDALISEDGMLSDCEGNNSESIMILHDQSMDIEEPISIESFKTHQHSKKQHYSITKSDHQLTSKIVKCNCIKSKCNKNYCHCYKSEQGCGKFCKCSGCENIFVKPLLSIKTTIQDFWKISHLFNGSTIRKHD